jgi:hypothetical protein
MQRIQATNATDYVGDFLLVLAGSNRICSRNLHGRDPMCCFDSDSSSLKTHRHINKSWTRSQNSAD